jgi:hypothetical protein
MSNANTSIAFTHMGKVHDTLIEKGVDNRILQYGMLEKGIVADFAEAAALGKIRDRNLFRMLLMLDPMKFAVSYGQSFEEMIKDCKFDYVEDEIENDVNDAVLGLVGNGVEVNLEGETFHFNRKISSAQVKEKMSRKDFRPARIEELLGFTAKFPWLQINYPIIALGTELPPKEGSQDIRRFCAQGSLGEYLNDNPCRSLVLDEDNTDTLWGPHCRFLGIRK